MAYVIRQEDMYPFMRRSPVITPGAAVQQYQAQEAAQPLLSLELVHKPFEKGNMFRFSASFARDVMVQQLQDDTMLSMHFQLHGYSDANIRHMGGWPFAANTHNIMYLEAPQLDILFPTQDKYRYFIITLTAGVLQEKFAHIPAVIAPLCEAIHHQRPIRAFDQNLPMQPAMYQVLQDMYNNPFTGDWQSFYLETKTMEMLALQVGQYAALSQDKQPGAELSARDTDTMHAIRAYATANFLEPLSLQGIARNFAINEYQLKKQFRGLFGQTLFQYIHQCKMVYAREQLSTTDKQVSEVAYELGYNHPSHFITSFSKYFGVRPGKSR